MKKKIDIIVPVYNEEGNVVTLVEEITKNIPARYEYEIIFVDDGSTDATLEKIIKLAGRNKKIGYLSFSRNFGHQIALKAGIDHSAASCVITMDSDLQHPPKYLKDLLKKWEQGYDVVNTERIDGKNISFFKSTTSKLFYFLVNLISDVNILKGGADFRLLDEKVVNVIKNLKESAFFMRGIVPWSGFKTTSIRYEVGLRKSGDTKFSIRKMILFGLDGVTSFSIKPLRIATFIGFFFAFISGLYGVYAIVVRLFYNQAIVGWASLVASVVFMGGLQLMLLGVFGEYMGKMFIQSKNRPLYIIKDKNLK